MFAFVRRLIYALSNKIWNKAQGDIQEARLIVDFAKSKKHPFNIKAEDSYNAYLSKYKNQGVLTLGVKKTNCIAFIDIPNNEYQDQVIDAKISLDSMSGYSSTGIIFRIMSQDSYYMALVSNKGYFRFDSVKDGSPRPLIAWTEVSDFDEKNIDIKIITYGSYLIFIVNGKWLAEISDDSIPGGTLGFALASYETEENEGEKTGGKKDYTCKAHLSFFSVDTRVKSIEQQFKKWTDDENINAEHRLRLAETFAVMDKPAKAMDQIMRAWKRRDNVIRGIATTYTEARTKKELLLASRMSFRLGQFNEALKFIDSILDQWPTSKEGKLAYKEKIKILNELDKFEDLKDFLVNQSNKIEKDIDYYTLLARCCWEMKEYSQSADAWKQAFALNGENGVYAANAANALESIDKKEEALDLYIEAGNIFLKQDNNAELESLMPKLTILGNNRWEARALAGKWLFSIEDYNRCEKEFMNAEKIRINRRPRPAADPAVYYLWGLVFYIKEKYKEAINLLEKAVKLAPDYDLFSAKLEEIKKISEKKKK